MATKRTTTDPFRRPAGRADSGGGATTDQPADQAQPESRTQEPIMSADTTKTAAPKSPAAPAKPADGDAATGAAAPDAAATAASAAPTAHTHPAAPAPTAGATIEELQAAFPDDPAFVLKAYGHKWTLGQAAIEQNKALRAELEAVRAGRAKLGAAGDAGVAAVQGAPRPAADAGDDYLKVVEARAAADKIPVHQAVTLVNRERPDLRRKYAFGGRDHPANRA